MVRRLTPTECERLMGYPDGFTDIPWKGGKAPDGRRYRALGNSMAVPRIGWILDRTRFEPALAAEAERVSNADWLHVDVMDNHFVPNLTLGLPVVERLAQVSELPLDVHLMIEDADRWAPAYAEAGAGSVTIHAKAAGLKVSKELEIFLHKNPTTADAMLKRILQSERERKEIAGIKKGVGFAAVISVFSRRSA